MRKIFTASLAIIGGVIGFILGMTVTFAMNSSSSLILAGFSIVFTIIGAIGLTKLAPYFDSVDTDIQKPLIVCCAIIAVILILFLIVSVLMLKSYYQVY